MDLGYPPPLSMALTSVGARDLAHRAAQLVAATRLRPGPPVAAVLAAVLVAWLFNAAGWGPSGANALTALCLGSLVATAALAGGWGSEPVELERWAARAVAAGVASALPLLFG
jgi:hypothetical protein